MHPFGERENWMHPFGEREKWMHRFGEIYAGCSVWRSIQAGTALSHGLCMAEADLASKHGLDACDQINTFATRSKLLVDVRGVSMTVC